MDGTEEARKIIDEAYRESGGPTEELRRIYQALLDNQQRLGPEFERVLYDNLWDLYDR